jgi:hypothetical protein
MRGITALRVLILLVNLGIIAYMGFLLRAGRRERKRLRELGAESHDSHGN